MRPPITPRPPFRPERPERPDRPRPRPGPSRPDPVVGDGVRPKPKRPKRDPAAHRRRLTPFLVLKLRPDDIGQRGSLGNIVPGMKTLVVATEGFSDVQFHLNSGKTYTISGMVSNLGRSPALMGIARLHIVTGTTLMQHWQQDVTPPFDVCDFQAWPGQDAPLRFRRPWTPGDPSEPLDRRISIFIHVIDLGGDTADFALTHPFADRHIARRDFRID